jgi:uncharacterized protein
LLGYPPGAAPAVALADEPFACLLHDPLETTLIVREQVAAGLPAPQTSLGGRRVILLEGQLPDDLHGFMAAVAGALAGAGVWLLALGAATRDHLLVADEQLEPALGALRALAAASRNP